MPSCFSNLNYIIMFLVFMISICFLLNNSNIEFFENEISTIKNINNLYKNEIKNNNHEDSVKKVLSKINLNDVHHKNPDSKKVIKAAYVTHLLHSNEKNISPIDRIAKSVHVLMQDKNSKNRANIKNNLLKLVPKILVNKNLSKLSDIKRELNNTFLENNEDKLNIIAAALKAEIDLKNMGNNVLNSIDNKPNGLESNIMDNLSSELENNAMSAGNSIDSAIDSISNLMSFDSRNSTADIVNTIPEPNNSVGNAIAGAANHMMDTLSGPSSFVDDAVAVAGAATNDMDTLSGPIVGNTGAMDTVSTTNNYLGNAVTAATNIISRPFSSLWD